MELTIRKIAQIAGVSRGTVDKVLHNRPGVSDKVRAAVKKIIKENEYKPNSIARALSSCNQKRVLGVVLLVPEGNAYSAQVLNGVQRAGREIAEFGFALDVRVLKTYSAQAQAKAIRSLEESGVCAIAAMALDSKEIDEALKEVSVPVVAMTSDFSSRLCFVGQDLKEGARIAAGLLGKCVGTQGTVAVLHGPQTMQAHKIRVNAFKEHIKNDYPGVTICKEVCNDDIDALSYEETRRIVKEFPQLSGLYLTGAGIRGACAALDECQKSALPVVCYDLNDDTRALLREGRIAFVVDHDAELEGCLAVTTLAQYVMEPQEKPSDTIFTPTKIFMKENI